MQKQDILQNSNLWPSKYESCDYKTNEPVWTLQLDLRHTLLRKEATDSGK